MGGCRVNIADESLTGSIRRMSLACVENLETADLFGDGDKPGGVFEQEAGAFVRCHAAGETKGEDGRIEVMAGALGQNFKEALLAFEMTGGDLRGIDAVDGAKVLVVGAPVGDLGVEQLLKGRGEPGGGVDPVGDGVHLVVGEHELRDLAVLHGDSIDIPGEAQGDVGHVHQAIVEAAGVLDGAGAVMAEDLVHLVEAELVVPSGDGGVGGEDALAADRFEVDLLRFAEGVAAKVLFKEADAEQRGVSLIHVIDAGLTAQGVEKSDAAETEDGLLAETVVGVASVEVVGETAVPLVVAFNVGVEEEDGDDVAGNADDVEAPGADENRPALHGEGNDLVGTGEGRFGRPGNIGFGLLANIIEALAEVAATVHERDGDHGTAGIGRGAEGIACQHAEATRVGGQGRVKGDFHGKVGDGARGEIGCSGGERVGKAQVVLPFLISAVGCRP